MKKLFKSILIATASLGTIAGSTAVVVSCGKAPAPEDKPVVINTIDQAMYLKEAQYISSNLTINIPIYVYQNDSDAKVKLAIATRVNILISTSLPIEKSKIGVISITDAQTRIVNSVPGNIIDTRSQTPDVVTKQVKITIPTIATSGVKEQEVTSSVQIYVKAPVSPDQANYDTAVQNVLAGTPKSTSPLFNWTAKAGTTPGASDHWLGGLTLKDYTEGELLGAFEGNDSSFNPIKNLITAAAPDYKALLDQNSTALGSPIGAQISFNSATITTLTLAKPGIYNFYFGFTFEGISGKTIDQVSLSFGFTITIN